MNPIFKTLSSLGNQVTSRIWRLGSATRLFLLILIYSGESFRRIHLTIREIYFTGVMSLIIIIVSAFFVGMVLGLQGYYTLQKYGSSESIGVWVALALLRELGPVVTALLFAGRAGTAITAEIGLMKATEQLSAMEMMAVSPIARIIGPRFWAGVISMPILASIFSMVGVMGGYLVSVHVLGFSPGPYISSTFKFLEQIDVVSGLTKAAFFGFILVVGLSVTLWVWWLKREAADAYQDNSVLDAEYTVAEDPDDAESIEHRPN